MYSKVYTCNVDSNKCVVMMKEVMRNELYCPGIKCDQQAKEEK